MSRMVTLRVPEEVLARIDARAKARGLNRTQLLIGPYKEAPPDCSHARARKIGMSTCPICGQEVN